MPAARDTAQSGRALSVLVKNLDFILKAVCHVSNDRQRGKVTRLLKENSGKL